jgi:hypothetical protein
MVPFKEILFKQQCYLVSELQVDALVPSVVLELICDPKTNEKECDVTFSSVYDLKVNYYGEPDDTKNEYLCILIDVADKVTDGKHYYHIATDTVDVSFYTAETPIINWVNPDKEYKSWESERVVWDKNT